MRKLILLLFFVICGFLYGCKPYVPNVQQGNIFNSKDISKIKLGMTKKQVTSVLGEPALLNVLNKNLVTYAYTNQINGGRINRKNIELF